eukprot:1153479-Pelagomonas_calceolata.AAC.4
MTSTRKTASKAPPLHQHVNKPLKTAPGSVICPGRLAKVDWVAKGGVSHGDWALTFRQCLPTFRPVCVALPLAPSVP